MLDTFKMFAAYNRYANAVVYAEAAKLDEDMFNQQTGAFFGSLCGTLNHILVGDRVWLNRFTGKGVLPKRLDENLFADLSDLTAARQAEDARIIDWVSDLSEEAVAGTFTYTPITVPQPVTQRLQPAVFHLFNHQTHHRGQAHMILTTLGRPSLNLDLISFQRTEEGRQWA